MIERRLLAGAATAAVLAFAGPPLGAQELPLGPVTAAGQTVTPAYEGWYVNPDGSISISFGYYNRNTEQVIDIPLGPDNYITPAKYDGMQPTRFHPRRHWGVFALNAPADTDERIVWTLRMNGRTFAIPAQLKTEWVIDALAGEAGAGNTPPVLSFSEGGPEAAGPAGIEGEPMSGRVGQPVEVTVWARDDGAPSGSVATGGRSGVPVTLTWFKHQGPGSVEFSEESARVPLEGGSMTTTATFSEPGDYVLRVRANDASGVAGAGHAQCCWTNGFVRITVNR